MSESNKALVREFFAKVWNEHNVGAAEQYLAASFVDHDPPAPGLPTGIEGAVQVFGVFQSAFPDLQIEIEMEVAEGDLVVVRWTSTGTHRGELMGIPASGRPISITGTEIMRIAGGKISDRWGNIDMAAMMRQIG